MTVTAPPRFFRLFDIEPTRFDSDFLLALGGAMAQDRMERVPLNIPSGYVYLGQFLAHDLTHQQGGTDVPAADAVAVEAQVQLNEPTLELDSVYGPNVTALQADNPAFSLRAGKFRLGAAREGVRDCPDTDLPRDATTLEALIPDFRNDENLLIGQLHLQFLKLHNFFFDQLRARSPQQTVAACHAQARQQNILHYQTIILYEWLEKLLDHEAWCQLIREDRRDCGVLWNTKAQPRPDMPVEFSFGAMRFGHAMVLPSYNITPTQTLKIEEAFAMTGRGGFAGRGHLPTTHVVDWTLFFGDPLHNPHGPLMNFALRITDTVALKLPPHVATSDGRHFQHLAKRNLIRAKAATVPSGQQVASLLLSQHADLCRLIGLDHRYLAATAKFLHAEANPVLRKVLQDTGRSDAGELEVPLWYYVLIEAYAHNSEQVDGNYRNWGRLGKVGSLIIAEVIRTLTELSNISVFKRSPDRFVALARNGNWVRGGSENVEFSTMLDLLNVLRGSLAGMEKPA